MIDFGYAEDLRELRSLNYERRSNTDLRMRDGSVNRKLWTERFELGTPSVGEGFPLPKGTITIN